LEKTRDNKYMNKGPVPYRALFYADFTFVLFKKVSNMYNRIVFCLADIKIGKSERDKPWSADKSVQVK